MRRRSYGKPPPRVHPLIVGPDKDFRGRIVCDRCGSTEDAAVHRLPELSDEQREAEARRVGERP